MGFDVEDDHYPNDDHLDTILDYHPVSPHEAIAAAAEHRRASFAVAISEGLPGPSGLISGSDHHYADDEMTARQERDKGSVEDNRDDTDNVDDKNRKDVLPLSVSMQWLVMFLTTYSDPSLI